MKEIETFFCGHCEEKKAYQDKAFQYHKGEILIKVCLGCSPNQKKKPAKEQINEQLLF